jgi:hypothetical protein
VVKIDASRFPLCQYFLSGYLSGEEDPVNFPENDGDDLFARYEKIFESRLSNFRMPKEQLKKRTEFSFVETSVPMADVHKRKFPSSQSTRNNGKPSNRKGNRSHFEILGVNFGTRFYAGCSFRSRR